MVILLHFLKKGRLLGELNTGTVLHDRGYWEVLDLVIQGRITGVIDVRIQRLQCNLCMNASVNTKWGYKVRGYRGY